MFEFSFPILRRVESTFQMGCYSIVVISLFFGSIALKAEAPSDIETLLQRADQALQAPEPAPPAPKKKQRSVEPAAPAAQPAPTAAEVLPTPAAPLDRRALSEILLADSAQRERGIGTALGDSLVRLGMGVAVLERGYSLEKDDDTFALSPGSSLWGVSFEFTPPLLGFPVFASGGWRSHVNVGLGAGAYFGNIGAQRTGVMQGNSNYMYYFFPLGGEVTLAFEYRSKFGIEFSYGYGAEALSQRGIGNSDTVSAVYHSDTAKIRLRAIFSRGIEGFALWQTRGKMLFNASSAAHSHLFSVGVGFGLSG